MVLVDISTKEYAELKRQAFTYIDIMKIYGVGRNKAYKIIQDIKKKCNGGKLGVGKVLKSEIEHWEGTF